jgi:hypothetical protein
MCTATRRFDRMRFWSTCQVYGLALLLLGACGSEAIDVFPPDAAADATPATKADAIDAPLVRDLGWLADVADSPAAVADAPSPSSDVRLGPPDAPGPSDDAPPVRPDAPVAAIDASVPSDASPAETSAPQCRELPLAAPAPDGGTTRWVWSYDPQVTDLGGLCASYGSRPRLILEVVVKGATNPLAPLPLCTAAEMANGGARACSVGDAYRFVADCATAEMLIELPTDGAALDAYVHMENGVVPSSPRQRAVVDARCARHLVGGLVPWSGTLPDLDAGVTGPDAGADAGDAIACGYPSTSRVDSSGKTYWWYTFDWRQDNLADICASYGAGAKMVVELSRGSTPFPITGLPVCTGEEIMGAGGRSCAVGARLEADCMAGQLLFEADAESGSEYSGYYFHIESPQFPDPPRRLLEADATCRRSLHPRFVPMAPAGSPDVGADTGGSFADLYDPSRSGQPCQTNADCPFYSQECVIDAAVTDCLAGPIGRCIPYMSSNCVAWPIGCYCLHGFGSVCSDFPGTSCGNLYPPGSPVPVNPQTGTRCHACLPTTY